MRFTVSEQGEYEVYPAGIYPAKLVSYADAGMGQFGKARVRLNWELQDEDGVGYESELPTWVSQVVSSKSTLYGVVCALEGVDALEEGTDVDLDELIGKRCLLTVTVVAKKEGGGDRNNVAAYSPLKRRAVPGRRPAATPTPARAAAPAAEDLASVPF